MSTTTTLGGWLVYVMRRADGALSLEEALHVIMDSLREYFPCQSLAVILIDDDTKELRIKISRQISYTFVKEFHKAGPSAIAERAVLEQEPILLNNLERNTELYASLKLEHDFTSAVLAPVVKNQRGIGYVFGDRSNGEPFNESDLLHLQVIGYLIGQIIEKFELVKASKRLSQIDDASKALQYKAFVTAMATELQRARTHSYPVALALMAVGAFRKYVETYGIDQAHALLAEVVSTVKPLIRDMDLLARFAADQFILCLSGTTQEEAQGKLAAIREAVATRTIGQGDAPVELTIGALTLETDAAKKAGVQEILGALGRQLADAKGRDNNSILVETLKKD